MIGLSHTIAVLHEEKPENNFCFDIENQSEICINYRETNSLNYRERSYFRKQVITVGYKLKTTIGKIAKNQLVYLEQNN